MRTSKDGATHLSLSCSNPRRIDRGREKEGKTKKEERTVAAKKIGEREKRMALAFIRNKKRLEQRGALRTSKVHRHSNSATL